MKQKVYEYDGSRIHVYSPFLLGFSAAFVIWQMGIVYFSGTVLSIFNRMPVVLVDSVQTAMIVSGYIFSVLFILLFSSYIVHALRFIFFVAFVCSVLLLFPFTMPIYSLLCYIEIFCCVFSIGTMACEAVQLFTVCTVWYDAVIGMMVAGVAICVMQNDFIKLSFSVFAVISVFLTAFMFIFQILIPSQISVCSIISPPKKYTDPNGKNMFCYHFDSRFHCFLLLIALSTLLLVMEISVAESITNGVSLMYLSGACFAVIVFFVCRKSNLYLSKIYHVFFMLAPIGFAFAIGASFLSWLSFLACIFFGFTVALSNMWIYFLSLSYTEHPSKLVYIVGTMIGFIVIFVHSIILVVFHRNIHILLYVYLILSIILMILMYLYESYFNFPISLENNSVSYPNKLSNNCPSTCVDVLKSLSISGEKTCATYFKRIFRI